MNKLFIVLIAIVLATSFAMKIRDGSRDPSKKLEIIMEYVIFEY